MDGPPNETLLWYRKFESYDNFWYDPLLDSFVMADTGENEAPSPKAMADIFKSLLDNISVAIPPPTKYPPNIINSDREKSPRKPELWLGPEEKLGAVYSPTLTSMINKGQWDEAAELEMEAMETLKEKLGADHPDILNSKANLAFIRRRQGLWDLSEELEVQLTEMIKKNLEADHPDAVSSMVKLAYNYCIQGRWHAAAELVVQVMETREKKLGANHPDTLTSMANLAFIYHGQGQLDVAKELEMRVMETCKKKLEADHPDVLNRMANLASIYRSQGQLDVAKELEMRVIESCKKKLEADHLDALNSMANLASIYRSQGQWDAAKELERQVMETYRKKLKADYSDALKSMANLASIQRRQGQWDVAKELEMRVIESCKKKLEADHPGAVKSMANLALIDSTQGQWNAAKELSMQGETHKEKLGPDHPHTLASMANPAYTLGHQGRVRLMDDCCGICIPYGRDLQYLAKYIVDLATDPATSGLVAQEDYEHTHSCGGLGIVEKIGDHPPINDSGLTRKHENGDAIDTAKNDTPFEVLTRPLEGLIGDLSKVPMSVLEAVLTRSNPKVLTGVCVIPSLFGVTDAARTHISATAVPASNTIAGGLGLTITGFRDGKTVGRAVYYSFYSLWGVAAIVTFLFTRSSVAPKHRNRYTLLFALMEILILATIVAASADNVDMMWEKLKTWFPLVTLLCAGAATMVCKKVDNPTSRE